MIALILVLVVIGVALELLKTKIPMDGTIRVVIQVVIVLCAVVYLLRLFGIADVPVPSLR